MCCCTRLAWPPASIARATDGITQIAAGSTAADRADLVVDSRPIVRMAGSIERHAAPWSRSKDRRARCQRDLASRRGPMHRLQCWKETREAASLIGPLETHARWKCPCVLARRSVTARESAGGGQVTPCPRIPTQAEVMKRLHEKTRLYSRSPDEGGSGMLTKSNLSTARVLGVGLVAALGLSGCATYSDEFATINSRLDQLDSRVQGAAQSAESANQSAQQANRRLDQIEGRVQQLETAPRRVPRG